VVDWAVRTRRINPFGGIARFFRARVDPLMLPVERRIVRSGGLPATAPWWTLAAVVVGGILFISLLGFVGGLLKQIAFGLQDPRGIPMLLLSWAFSFLKLALLVRRELRKPVELVVGVEIAARLVQGGNDLFVGEVLVIHGVPAPGARKWG
jgi:hypothetical protein